MTRMQQFNQEVNNASRLILRQNMPEAKILAVEFCHDILNISYSFSWTVSSCASGMQKKYIKSLGFVVCKRDAATAQIIIGERPDGSPYVGCWKSKASKSYWLKPLI